MEKLIQFIHQADESQIQCILDAALSRWQELYPDWEISTLRLHREADRKAQLDQTIAMLERLKQLD